MSQHKKSAGNCEYNRQVDATTQGTVQMAEIDHEQIVIFFWGKRVEIADYWSKPGQSGEITRGSAEQLARELISLLTTRDAAIRADERGKVLEEVARIAERAANRDRPKLISYARHALNNLASDIRALIPKQESTNG